MNKFWPSIDCKWHYLLALIKKDCLTINNALSGFSCSF